jgi:hypothetical protein
VRLASATQEQPTAAPRGHEQKGAPMHDSQQLDQPAAEALLARQTALQMEAQALLDDLKLLEVLGQLGQPIVVGSVALGLMAWRDLDVSVLCPELDTAAIHAAMRPLAADPRLLRYECRIELGERNPDPTLPDGIYWGLRCRALDAAVEPWKCDIWFLRADAPQGDLAHLETLPPKLTPETRLAILWLKSLWSQLPIYRTQVYSVDIYDAVLEHDVRTPEAFRVFLRERGKPAE